MYKVIVKKIRTQKDNLWGVVEVFQPPNMDRVAVVTGRFSDKLCVGDVIDVSGHWTDTQFGQQYQINSCKLLEHGNGSVMVKEEQVQGRLDRIIFDKPETGFRILSLVDKLGKHRKVAGKYCGDRMEPGDTIVAIGFWEKDRWGGDIFRAKSMAILPPSTQEEIQKYLGSGRVAGIGPVTAKAIVSAFGVHTVRILDTEPQKLRLIDGIGPKRCQQIIDSWEQFSAMHRIMMYLVGCGVTTGIAARIFKEFGSDAPAIVRNDPYRLSTAWGIGFSTADRIAQASGIASDDPKRIRAAVLYTLDNFVSKGNCGMPSVDLLAATQKVLSLDKQDLVQESVSELVGSHSLVSDTIAEESCIFPRKLHECESELAQLLAFHQATNHAAKIGSLNKEDVKQSLLVSGVSLDDSQKRAVMMALSNSVSIITGGPGSGKTTVLRSIVDILHDNGIKVSLCAPTGRAAKRMAESCNMEATTIHRLLHIDPETGDVPDDLELGCGMLLVDESSMLDVILARKLLRKISSTIAVVFVGDVDQLDAVGQGAFLSDCIHSGRIPFTRLTGVHRQAAGSGIVSAAVAINAGHMPVFSSSGDCRFIECQPHEETGIIQQLLSGKAVEIASKALHSDFNPVEDVQVLSPMKDKTCGTKELNGIAQSIFCAGMPTGPRNFSVGSKVIQLRNNYKKRVFNGDIGYVALVDSDYRKLTVNYGGTLVEYDFTEADELSLAYAITIHKSQGSEFPIVIVPVSTVHYIMLRKSLLYTALTRAKKMAFLVGSKKALAVALSNKSSPRRWTRLAALLNGGLC